MGERHDNSGTLGRNRRKEKDTHPSHTGRALIDGVEYWIDAWVKDGRDGERFFSMRFKRNGQAPPPSTARTPPARSQTPAGSDFDDDIPF